MNKLKVAFGVLLVLKLASNACAVSDSVRLAELLAENADLKDRATRAEAEIRLLRAESARRVSEMGLEISERKSRLHSEESALIDLEHTSETHDTNNTTKNESKLVCEWDNVNAEDHCNKKCSTNVAMIDENCKMTEEAYVGIPSRIKQVGTDRSPKWNIVDDQGGLLGTVSCPCNGADGTTLTEEDAIKVIVGQVAAMGMPAAWKARLCAPQQKYWPSMWNGKVTISAIVMLKCWHKKCAGGGGGFLSIDDLLLDDADSFGGGSEC